MKRRIWIGCESYLMHYLMKFLSVFLKSDDAMERLLKLIVEHSSMLTDMFHQLIDELKIALPDLGKKTAVDSKAMQSFGNPVTDEKKLSETDGRRDTDADWGKKTYKGTRKDGTTWAPRDTRFARSSG